MSLPELPYRTSSPPRPLRPSLELPLLPVMIPNVSSVKTPAGSPACVARMVTVNVLLGEMSSECRTLPPVIVKLPLPVCEVMLKAIAPGSGSVAVSVPLKAKLLKLMSPPGVLGVRLMSVGATRDDSFAPVILTV